VMDELGAKGSGWYLSAAHGLDVEGLLAALREAERDGTAVLIAGTSFTFVHLFDAMRERGVRVTLPAGSRVMDTGGFKGRSREVGREELLTDFQALLGVPPTHAVNEYGMTEMTSQFYDGTVGSAGDDGRLYRGPHWVRSAACDPETLKVLEPGSTGILRHWDLGNLSSILALQTSDLGRVLPDGRFELYGRAPGAEARGCSIAMDELLQAMGGRPLSS
jgi:hypothetical protein